MSLRGPQLAPQKGSGKGDGVVKGTERISPVRSDPMTHPAPPGSRPAPARRPAARCRSGRGQRWPAGSGPFGDGSPGAIGSCLSPWPVVRCRGARGCRRLRRLPRHSPRTSSPAPIDREPNNGPRTHGPRTKADGRVGPGLPVPGRARSDRPGSIRPAGPMPIVWCRPLPALHRFMPSVLTSRPVRVAPIGPVARQSVGGQAAERKISGHRFP